MLAPISGNAANMTMREDPSGIYFDDFGDSVYYVEADYKVLPDTPTDLAGTVISSTENDLTWNESNPDNAESYNIYRNGQYFDDSRGETFYHDVYGAPPGTDYTVTAYNDVGESAESNYWTSPSSERPHPPTALTGTRITGNVNLSWTNVDDADSYNIYRNGVLIGSSGTNTYDDTSSSDPIQYNYNVTAVNTYGESGFSNTWVAAPISVPYAPINLSGSRDILSVRLTWDTALGAKSYNIYRSGVLIGVSTGGSYIDYLGDPTIAENYYVTGVNSYGESAESNTYFANPFGIAPAFTPGDDQPAKRPGLIMNLTVGRQLPATPAGLTGTRNISIVSLTWGSSLNANSYNIYRNNIIIGSSSTNSFVDANPDISTFYVYSVTAVNTAGNESAKSNTYYPDVPGAPSGLAGTHNAGHAILSWPAIAGAQFYRVYRTYSVGAYGTFLFGVSTNAYTDTTRNPSIQTMYTITGVNANGQETKYSNVYTVPPGDH
jgi:fibronectin type 3 domain-containing protein